MPGSGGVWVEPPIGIESMTYALREARSLSARALAAPIARLIARMASAGNIRRPGPRTGPRPRSCVPGILLLCVNVADDIDPHRKRIRSRGRLLICMPLRTQVRLAAPRICMPVSGR